MSTKPAPWYLEPWSWILIAGATLRAVDWQVTIDGSSWRVQGDTLDRSNLR